MGWNSAWSRRGGANRRRGQALVEFAIISFVMTALLAGFLGLLVMGLGSFQNNIAAESAGRLLDRRLASTLTSPQEVYDALVVGEYYDETKLILTKTEYYDSAFRSSLPEINRLLLSSYIYDPDLDRYRYPGAVVTNASSQQTVLVPLLPDASLGKDQGIDRAFHVDSSSVPVADDWVGPVCVASTDEPDVFRLVIFYPSQPGSMVNFEVVRDSEGRIISQTPVVADDSAVSLSSLPTGYNLLTPAPVTSGLASTSRGEYGLGETFALNASVRPFRVVFESSTLFRLAED